MYSSLNDLNPPNTITQTISLVTLNDETECQNLSVTDRLSDSGRVSYIVK